MKNILIVAAVCMSSFLLCGQGSRSFKSVDVCDFEKVLSDTSFVVLDVRTHDEHSEGYIPGTDYNIDVLEAGFEETAVKLIPAGKSVALYCRSGKRSKTAAKKLSSKGYTVVELSSGFRGWQSAGKPVEK